MTKDEKICLKCSWNDPDYGCTSDIREAVYQCPLYMKYHPEEVKKFNEEVERWNEKR